jgi:Protein of unknown function (DUF3987)
MIADITPKELLRDCDSVTIANGFLNRFLLSFAHRTKLLSRGGNFDADALARIAAKVRKALNEVSHIGELSFSHEALAAWDKLYPVLTRPRIGLLDEMTARAEAHTARLAFVFAMLDGVKLVTCQHLAAAAALWEFCESTVKHIFGDRLGDAVPDTILTALRERPGVGMSRSEISALFARHMNGDELSRALQLLMNTRLATRMTKGSHTAERWFAAKREEQH